MIFRLLQHLYNISPLPLYEFVLSKFVTHLADESLQYRSIKMYLSGLRYFQISAGLGDTYHGHMSALDYVLKGVKQVWAMSSNGPRERVPISLTILCKIQRVWSVSAHDPDSKLLWAACCLCVSFAFLRAGEMTTPDEGGYDPAVHLSYADAALDNPRKPSFMRITIKQSKSDPFRTGMNLYIGRTGTDLYP